MKSSYLYILIESERKQMENVLVLCDNIFWAVYRKLYEALTQFKQ